MDSGLREILTESGAEEYGPILAMRGISSKQLVFMKDKDLLEVKRWPYRTRCAPGADFNFRNLRPPPHPSLEEFFKDSHRWDREILFSPVQRFLQLRELFASKVNKLSFCLFISHKIHFTCSQGLLYPIIIRRSQWPVANPKCQPPI